MIDNMVYYSSYIDIVNYYINICKVMLNTDYNILIYHIYVCYLLYTYYNIIDLTYRICIFFKYINFIYI